MLHEGSNTIGASGSRGGKRNPKQSVGFTSKLSATDSREMIVQEIPLQNVRVSGEPSTHSSYSPNVVYISTEVDVVHESASGISDDDKKHGIHENW